MSASEKHPVKTRIVVLEEHPLLRHGIAHFLNSQEDMIVCGETDNIRDARHKIQELKPHLLLTALRLGTGDSLEFLKALKSERPALLILVYSAFEETIFAERTFRAAHEHHQRQQKESRPFPGRVNCFHSSADFTDLHRFQQSEKCGPVRFRNLRKSA